MWDRVKPRSRSLQLRWVGAVLLGLLLLVGVSCSAKVTPDGWPARWVLPLSADVLVHLLAVLGAALLLLCVGAALPVVWRHQRAMRALGHVRCVPSGPLRLAATQLVPLNRLYELSIDEPFAACIGWWQPRIYISRALLALPSDALRAALAHEEAHRRAADPLRFFLLHLLQRIIPGRYVRRQFIEQVTLRAEVRADRFARTQVSRSALALALLAMTGTLAQSDASGARVGTDGVCQRLIEGAYLLHAEEEASSDYAQSLFAERLRYLQLAPHAPLPAVRLGTIFHPVMLPGLLMGLSLPVGLAVLLAISVFPTLHHALPAALACVMHA